MNRAALFLLVPLLAACNAVKVPIVGNPASPDFQSLETTGTPALPGARADGSTLLPSAWSLRPAGRQLPLGDFPVNLALHPSGRFAAILHAGYGAHRIAIVDLKTEAVVTNVALPETWYGLAFSHDGRTLVASGAGDETLHVYAFVDGVVSDHRTIRLRPVKERGIPAGFAVSRDGATVYAANVWGHRISIVDLAQQTSTDLRIGASAAVTTENLPKPSADFDLQAAEKRQQQTKDVAAATDPFPYSCVVDESRGRLYVSLWAQAAVAVIDLKTRTEVARWPVQEHPNEMLLTRDGRRLFVANANRNTVSVLDPATGRAVETLSAAMTPDAPAGNTPDSLALSPDERLLFIANANVNNIAVFDVSEPGRSRSLGFIPAGWYPTSVRVTPDGRRLLIANGKGGSSFPNPKGPQPVAGHTTAEYIGGLMKGSLGIVDLPRDREALEAALKGWTATALACAPKRTTAAADAAKLPPIKYCIYLIKENRTYDQVLGDMPEGNGDPSLCIFPEKVTPNLHALAREYVLLDNFYCDGEVSADGHEWTMGAYATDFVEKTWPLGYGHNRSGKFPYPSEGGFPIAAGSGGYLWDKAAEAGVSYRSYAEFCANTGPAGTPVKARLPVLAGHIDEQYRAFDLNYPDVKRAERFAAELARFEREGDMPRLQVVRLGNDHTYGTSPGKLTPTAMVAENDVAVGRFIESLSRSRFWKETAVFIVQDDAQNGPDHVDAHRTTAYLVSPWTRGRGRDSTLYSTCSMLRTMELLLGLKPMTQFDAAATPMTASFVAAPDTTPFVARPAQVSLTATNNPLAWGAKASSRMNFAREDAADDLQLNEVIWRSVRGPDSPMPPPVRAAFVFASNRDDD